ncbi:hypothetical protein KNP414_07594 [Paenibacillus mucilaginosus KNP414]|uniref:Uncharacterized protein n=1 Tax=Paenibacillus mucilaginosus (strain KNP414) TaxID=1036673 RepID=F8FCJ3_PAEMK|nr:hypothetical protein KNP414_07594 [Paenibacillus mucilaginosus KNP414]
MPLHAATVPLYLLGVPPSFGIIIPYLARHAKNRSISGNTKNFLMSLTAARGSSGSRAR